ncbi:MAG: DUF1302 domain-containing protein [Nevskiaceae bacterium]|nr:MAG: DUF1302 domain-containing protein [Nevskiaceae bacterium]
MFRLTALACGCIASFGAAAYSEERDGVNIDLQNRFTVGAAMRVQNRSADLVSIANGGKAYSNNFDDGNLAFDKGQIYASVAKLTSDLTVSRNGFGLFVRGSAFFNDAQNGRGFFNPANYNPDGNGNPNPTREAPASELARKNHDVQAHNGKGVDWLDTYVYGNVPVFDRTFSFKLGRQVLNWGESTFVLNGINSMVALDANRARVPGFELNEVIIPTPMAWASMGLTDNSSIEGFYQLTWQKTIIDASGTYFSTNDFAGIGGTRADLSFGLAPENTPGETVTRSPDRKARNGGQYGVALHGFASWLHDTDFGFYAMNYHSRLPLYSGISSVTPPSNPLSPIAASSARYFAEFPEDIHLYGLSFNTTLPWGLALQGEYSFKDGQPIQIDDVELLFAGVGVPNQVTGPVPGAAIGNKYIRGWRRKGVSQADVGLTKIFGPSDLFKWDQVIGLFEAGYMHVHGMEPQRVLRYDGPGTFLPGDAATAATLGLPQQHGGYATPNSWGYNVVARFSYNNVLDLFTLEPTVRFTHDVKGISPTPVSNFVEGRKQIDLTLGFRFHNDISTEVGYTTYFGGGKQNLLADRDYVDLVVKYAF